MSSELEPHVAALVASYLEEFGEDSLRMALAAGHLFPATLRQGGKRALQHSAEHAEDGTPHTLVIQVTPRAKDEGRKVDIRLSSGPADVVLRAPLERVS